MIKNLLFSFFVLYFFGCEETLPAREAPNLFDVSIHANYDASHASSINQIVFQMVIVNKYDETIEDKAAMKGSYEIEWLVPEEKKPQFNVKRTGTLDSRNIFHANGFNKLTGVLTFQPRDTIIIGIPWDFITDDSSYLIPYFPYGFDYSCQVFYNTGPSYRKITKSQKFRISTKFQLTQQTSILRYEDFIFNGCFVVPYSGGDRCTPLNGIDPCSLIK